jgi:hypothetical protein
MILNSLFPVFAVIFLGSVLRQSGFAAKDFFSTADRLVYYIFFPCMLFWKISTGRPSAGLDLPLVAAVFCSVILIFVLSTLYIVLGKVKNFQAGSFSQSCYRFNSYIGMAIILKALGDSGVVIFAVLIGLIIPVINFLSVSVLIWFSDNIVMSGKKGRYLGRALATNPLILACLAGIAYSASGLGMPVFADNTFSLVSMVTLPLALISIGSVLSLKQLAGNIGLSAAAAVFKLIVLPAAGLFFMKIFGVTQTAYQVGLIFFCLPTSTAIYVLSSQMNSDTQLASASIVVSTLLSFVSLSVALVFI